MAALKYIQQWYDGLISEAEFNAVLDKLQIHGGIEAISGGRCSGVKFTGFDYRNQQWISLEIG